MSDALVIRPGAASDLPPLLAIEQGGFGADAFSPRQLRYLLARAKGAFFVAEWKGQTAGYISLLTSARHNQARVYSLVVSPHYRGHGIAEAMLDAALDFARAGRFRAVFLEVRPDNQAALALYHKKGFAKRGVIANYYHDGSPADSMKLEL